MVRPRARAHATRAAASPSQGVRLIYLYLTSNAHNDVWTLHLARAAYDERLKESANAKARYALAAANGVRPTERAMV